MLFPFPPPRKILKSRERHLKSQNAKPTLGKVGPLRLRTKTNYRSRWVGGLDFSNLKAGSGKVHCPNFSFGPTTCTHNESARILRRYQGERRRCDFSSTLWPSAWAAHLLKWLWHGRFVNRPRRSLAMLAIENFTGGGQWKSTLIALRQVSRRHIRASKIVGASTYLKLLFLSANGAEGFPANLAHKTCEIKKSNR